MTGDAKVTRYMGFATHTHVDQATDLIRVYKGNPAQRWLAVTPKADQADVRGVCGFEVQGHSATLTLMFRSDWKARGAGLTFARLFVEYIFTHPTIWRVWSYVHVDNLLGQRATERTGAFREGRLRRFEYFPNLSTTEPQDVYVYAIVGGPYDTEQECVSALKIEIGRPINDQGFDNAKSDGLCFQAVRPDR